MNIYRHGDLSFHPLKELPEGLKEINQDGKYTLAYGEHTGHTHVIEAPSKTMRIFKDSEGRYVLEVKSAATISHQEHSIITLQPGIYRQEQEVERDPFLEQIKMVQD